MMKKTMAALFVGVMSLLVTQPVKADIPVEGFVLEGDSVPGIALGNSRAQVEAVCGAPEFCQGPGQSYCVFQADGFNQLSIQYRGATGGEAKNSPDDVVFHIRWGEQIDGWVTTEGINTTLSAEDPESVLDAYPNAVVDYYESGAFFRVTDYKQGIEVLWSFDFETGTSYVSMAIFFPRTAPPVPEKIIQVVDIDLEASRVKGKRKVSGFVQIRNESGLAAKRARVDAIWTNPDGSTQNASAITSNSGYAYFEIPKADRGIYTLRIDDVVLDDYRFDHAISVLSDSATVK